jgi:hypothetical protein
MQDEQTRTRYAQLLGLAFCAAGFVAIGLGWRGAARVACIDCQVPYLISGAATGVGLIILGVGLIIGARIRVERMRLAEHMTSLMGGAPVAAEAGPGPRAAANGHVVLGGNSYHRPDCRLVREKSGLTMVTIEEAQSSGLSACRVCHPERAEARSG